MTNFMRTQDGDRGDHNNAPCMPSPLKKLGCALAALALASIAAVLFVPVRSAPEARFSTLDGESFATSDLRGKVVLVSFWSTTCSTCLKEMPRMARRYRQLAPRGYETVAVAMRSDQPRLVADLVERRSLPFKIALDPSGDIAKRFGGVHSTPTLFLIARDGRVLKQLQGKPDWGEVDSLIERALQ